MKMTQTAKYRKFEEVRRTKPCLKGEKCTATDCYGDKHIMDTIIRRSKILKVKPREEKGCMVCRRVMHVAGGQIARYHGDCRQYRAERRFIIKRS